MISLQPTIDKIEKLLDENTIESLTYAALECRLSIERICYERFRLAHDYISHDDIKRWQPRDIVKTLIREVDTYAARTFTVSISSSPIPDSPDPLTREDFEAIDYLPVGTQVGFNPNTLGSLWNALSKLALHINIPENKAKRIGLYGDADAIRRKVEEALAEIKRINEGTLTFSGGGKNVEFHCICGSDNKRRLDLLEDKQLINCINPECPESYHFDKEDKSFNRIVIQIDCKACNEKRVIPRKILETLRYDQRIHFDCEGCGETIYVCWRPMQSQESGNKT